VAVALPAEGGAEGFPSLSVPSSAPGGPDSSDDNRPLGGGRQQGGTRQLLRPLADHETVRQQGRAGLRTFLPLSVAGSGDGQAL
jgi:hypothetical protein